MLDELLDLAHYQVSEVELLLGLRSVEVSLRS
jgi:hypothetical protein